MLAQFVCFRLFFLRCLLLLQLNSVKQQYHLTHQQAARAFGISRAFTKLIKGVDNMSHLEAVKCLTEKLSNATFVNAGDVEPRAPAPSASSENTTTTRKMSEIHLPEISKHCPPSLSERRPKSPSKRSKSISGCTKTNKNKQSTSKMMRKRNLDEIGTANTQQSTTKQEPNGSIETRHRSDSVSEAVSAKIQKQDPSMMNGEKQSSRAKRRSTGSLDDSDAGPVVKRGRATTA